jgi:flagellin-like protein
MRRKPRRRFWVEGALALVSAVLFAITLLWHDWIEIVFGVDPDEGNGLAEVITSAVFLAMTLVSAASSRFEWRRTAAVSG